MQVWRWSSAPPFRNTRTFTPASWTDAIARYGSVRLVLHGAWRNLGCRDDFGGRLHDFPISHIFCLSFPSSSLMLLLNYYLGNMLSRCVTPSFLNNRAECNKQNNDEAITVIRSTGLVLNNKGRRTVQVQLKGEALRKISGSVKDGKVW